MRIGLVVGILLLTTPVLASDDWVDKIFEKKVEPESQVTVYNEGYQPVNTGQYTYTMISADCSVNRINRDRE